MLVIVSAIVATALVLRLAGSGPAWLPSAGRLMLLLVASHLIAVAWRARHVAQWRDIVSRHRFLIALAAVTGLALIVRVPGYAGDLGHVPLDIDEHRLASNVKHYFATGQLVHDTVEHYPGAVFWMLAAASFVSFVVGLAGGLDWAPSMLPVETYANAARMANVWAGALTVAVTGLIGRRIGGESAGIVAALVAAIVPLSVDTTTVVRNDAGMVLAVVAAVLAAMVFEETGRRTWGVAAGALAGVAAGIKYSGVFVIVPVLLGACARGSLRERAERAGLATLGFVLAVAISNHFVWTDPSNFLLQLASQVAITGRGHWAASDNPAAFYLMILDRFGPGWPFVLLAAAFAIHGLSTRRAASWIVLAFPLLYLWFMTGRPSQFPRWVYPLVPFVAVAGATVLSAIVRAILRMDQRRTPAMRYVAWLAAATVVVAAMRGPLWTGTVSFSQRVSRMTHTQVETWIKDHAAPGAIVLVGSGWLDLTGSNVQTRRVADLNETLNGGVTALAATGADWIVVPEPWFGHATLRRLGFLHRFQASGGFGGSRGYDYDVYAIPKR